MSPLTDGRDDNLQGYALHHLRSFSIWSRSLPFSTARRLLLRRPYIAFVIISGGLEAMYGKRMVVTSAVG